MNQCARTQYSNGAGRPSQALVIGTVLVLAAGGWPAGGGDWTQYRGPDHNGISTERIRVAWASEAPRLLWKKTLTDGFSSFAVSQGRAFTLVSRTLSGTKKEVCLALNASTGTELWAAPVGLAAYPDGGADPGDGPRSTPAVAGGRVYAYSADLNLSCLNATNGQVLWSRNLVADFGAQNIPWQNAASPLVDGDYIFLNCNSGSGPTLLALRQDNGGLIWRVQTDKMTHATPIAATLQGVRQVLFHTQPGLVSVNPQTGAVLWRYSFSYNGTSSAASPVVEGDMVVCSAAYNKGSAGVRITRSGSTFTATQVWRKTGNNLGNHWSTPVAYQGYLYGLFGSASTTLPLKCLDLATGTELWSHSGFGSGGVLLVNGKVLVQSEAGDLVLVEANPAAYAEVARYHALAGKSWNSPAISDGRIYARSTTEGVCLEVAVPPLCLQAVQCSSSGRFQFQIACANGQPLPAWRIPKVQVRSAPYLSTPLTNWTPAIVSMVLTNQVLQVEGALAPGASPQYFIVQELP